VEEVMGQFLVFVEWFLGTEATTTDTPWELNHVAIMLAQMKYGGVR
jgi:hypothetical protein